MFSLPKSAAGFVCGAFFMVVCNQGIADDHNCTAFDATQTVTVAKVIDGDTIRLKDGRKVRLIGINAPELGHNGKPNQLFSRAAQQALEQFLGKRARLLLDKDKTDNHRRTLAHLYNLNGESAEVHLLKQGLAWHVAIPPNLALAECLADAEQQAQQQRLGVWSSAGKNPVAAKDVSEGGFQIITGKVTKIKFAKSAWWIELGPQIATVIYRENQHRFDRKEVQALQGKTISVRGWVYPSRSKKYQPWRIKLETPYGLNSGKNS